MLVLVLPEVPVEINFELDDSELPLELSLLDLLVLDLLLDEVLVLLDPDEDETRGVLERLELEEISWTSSGPRAMCP